MAAIDNHPRKAAVGSLAAGILLAGPLISGFEGMRTHAYLDSARIATICEGIITYTDGRRVKMGDVVDVDTCIDLRNKDVAARVDQMQRCLEVPVSPVTAAWMISFGYNVGVAPYCKRVASNFNAGRQVSGCNWMRQYVYAGGAVNRGLVTRRGKEATGCLAGLT